MAAAAGQATSPGGVSPASEPPGAGEDAGIEDARWRPVLGLPCQLTVDLPLPHFTVADFLRLRAGSVISTEWRVTRDVPLRINGTLVAWGEFEGASSRLAVRVMELA